MLGNPSDIRARGGFSSQSWRKYRNLLHQSLVQMGKLRSRGLPPTKAVRRQSCAPPPPIRPLSLAKQDFISPHSGGRQCRHAELVRESDLFILVSPTLGTMPETHKGPFYCSSNYVTNQEDLSYRVSMKLISPYNAHE